MSRSRLRRPRQKTAPPELSTLLILLVVLAGIWLYQNGYVDRILRGEALFPPAAVEAPELEDGAQAQAPRGPEPVVPQPSQAPVASAAPQQSLETGVLLGYAGPWYQVYFTKPAYPEGPDDRSGGLDETMAADIGAARRTVDVATFDFDLPRLGDALIEARARGVAVRVAVDGENLATPEVARLVGELEAAGIPVTVDQRDAFMHNKFIVIDNAVLWTGSANLTVNGMFRNNNNMLRITSAPLAANYTAKMDDLAAGTGGTDGGSVLVNPVVSFGESTVATMFAPDDPITDEIVMLLGLAQQRIDVLSFALTSDPVAGALHAARDRGVAVRAVMESRNAKGTGSDFEALQRAGVDIHTDGNCYIMHHKVIVIDGRIVITGSFNFTNSAQRQNDENVLIVDDVSLAVRYMEEFERVYQQALQPTRCG